MNKTIICNVCCGLLLLVGLALVIIGSLIVRLVDDRIETGVKELLIIPKTSNPDTSTTWSPWSETRTNDWVKTTTNYTYYAWNITNLNTVLQGAGKPILQQVGPFSVNEKNEKFNMAFGDDGTFAYNQWWQKKWKSAADAQAETVIVNSLNPAYIAAVGRAKNASFGASSTETTLLVNFIAPVISGLQSTFLDETGTFLTAIRVLSVRSYLLGVRNTLTTSAGFTPAQVIDQWRNGTTLLFNNPALTSLKCFESISPLTDNNTPRNSAGLDSATATALWDTASATSLVSSAGIQNWLLFLTGAKLLQDGKLSTTSSPTAAQFSALSTTLNTVYGGAANVQNVATWIGLITSLTSYCRPFYQGAVVPGFATNCPSAVTWSDLGACQFGRSGVTRTAGLGDTFLALSPSSLAACTGLNSTFNIDCRGPELYAYGTSNYAAPRGCSADSLSLTIAESRAFLNTFNASGLLPLSQSCTTGALGASHFLGLAQTSAATAIAAYTFAGVTAGRLACLSNYLSVYIPNNFFMIPNVINKNGGLFTTRPPSQIMLGYPSDTTGAGNDPMLDTLNIARNVSRRCEVPTPAGTVNFCYTGILSNYTSRDNQMALTNQRKYSLYTGATNINKVRFYKEWRGATYVQDLLSVYRPSECFCNSTNPADWEPCNPSNCARTTCSNIWTVQEPVDGSSTGTNFAPFQEGKPAVNYKVFAAEAMRSLDMIYLGDSEVKGIKTRRFGMDPTQLQNATQNPNNARYRMNGPRGVAWMADWFVNIPVYLARPQFAYDADPSLAAQFDSSSWANIEASDDRFLTYVDVEPLSGAAVKGHKRLQYTLKLSSTMFNNPFYAKMFSAAPVDDQNPSGKAFYWPAFWADENGLIEDDAASDFRKAIYDNRNMAEALQIGGIVIGSFLVLLSVFVLYYVNAMTTPTNKSTSGGSNIRLESRGDMSI